MPIIRVKRDYCGEEGTGPDKDVLAGSEHSVTRARAAALKANGLIEIVSDEAHPDDDASELRTDGPTIAEYVAAGYPATAYPPVGYASRSTAEEIADAVAAAMTVQPENEMQDEKAAPPETKAAPKPRNKADKPAENKGE